MDESITEYFKNGDMSIVSEVTNEKVGVKPLFDTKKLNEWAKLWEKRSAKGATLFPLITVSRSQAPINSVTPESRFIIPDRKKYLAVKVPYFDGVFESYEMYKIPQPVRVDIPYEINFYTTYMTDVNLFFEKLSLLFSGKHKYIFTNGYPTALNEKARSWQRVGDKDKEVYYECKVDIIMEGRIVKEGEFQNITPIKQIRFPLIPPSVQDKYDI